MNHPKQVAASAILVIAVVMATACGGTTTASTVGPGSKATPGTPALPAVPGFDPATNTIHLGLITPLTGTEAVVGKPLAAGMETWFAYENSLGGIAGRYKVKLDEQDSQNSPQRALQEYNTIKGGDVLIAQLQGTAATNAVLPQLRQDGVVASPADLSSDWVHDPNLLPVGAPYQVQMINGAAYAETQLGLKGKVFCSLVQNDSYGQAGQAGIDFAASLLGFTTKTIARYDIGATDLTAQIRQLKTNACDLVFLVSTPDITEAALGQADSVGFAPQWIGTSVSYLDSLIATPIQDYLVAHYLVVSEGPEWDDPSTKGESDLLDRQAQFAPTQQPDYNFVFGYYQAWAVSQVIEQALTLGDLSRSGILSAMTTVGTLKFDGLVGDYRYGSPAQRDPPRDSSIYKLNPIKPAGLELLKGDFVSDQARAFSGFSASP